MKYTLTVSLFLASLLFSGCQSSSSNGAKQQAAEKAPVTTITGTLVQSGNTFVIKEKNGKTTEANSYTIKVGDYVGKTVTVSGQFSGTTLYLDTIVSAQ